MKKDNKVKNPAIYNKMYICSCCGSHLTPEYYSEAEADVMAMGINPRPNERLRCHECSTEYTWVGMNLDEVCPCGGVRYVEVRSDETGHPVTEMNCLCCREKFVQKW